MIYIASDHRGYLLKKQLIEYFGKRNEDVSDVGTFSEERVDASLYDKKAIDAVLEGKADFAILICGTGIISSIYANRFKGIRAALVTTPLMASRAKEHNNANILVFGSEIITAGMAEKCIRAYQQANYLGGRYEERNRALDEVSD